MIALEEQHLRDFSPYKVCVYSLSVDDTNFLFNSIYVINVLRIENRSKSLESAFFLFKIPLLSSKKLSQLLPAKQSRDIPI